MHNERSASRAKATRCYRRHVRRRKDGRQPEDAGAARRQRDEEPEGDESRFNAARETLAKQPSVDPARIGAAGYCFGGAWC